MDKDPRIRLSMDILSRLSASWSSRYTFKPFRCGKLFISTLQNAVALLIYFRGDALIVSAKNVMIYILKHAAGADSVCTGEVSERLKEHDWKSCVGQLTEGSNPSLSAIYYPNHRHHASFPIRGSALRSRSV